MTIDELMIPAAHVDLFYALIARNGGIIGAAQKSELVLSKEAAIELFIRLGARGEIKNESIGVENEKMNENSILVDSVIENQEDEYAIPKAILEKSRKEGQNLIRAIMEHKNLQLKEVALRYGGKSAAANLSNFLAKTDEELGAMRVSTMTRLAKAMNCPTEWLLQLKKN